MLQQPHRRQCCAISEHAVSARVGWDTIYSLALLQVPTPFLMGLHSSEDVDPRLLDSLVVVDLDRDIVSLGKDDVLMQRCLNHPYMKQLTHRIRRVLALHLPLAVQFEPLQPEAVLT